MPNIKLVDAFTDFVEESTLPYRQMMTYYNCALMEVETKFKVLNEQTNVKPKHLKLDNSYNQQPKHTP